MPTSGPQAGDVERQSKPLLNTEAMLDEVYRFLRKVAPSRFRRALRTQARFASQGATDMVHKTMEAFIRRVQAQQGGADFSEIQCARAYALQLLVWTMLDYQRQRQRRLEKLRSISEKNRKATAAAINEAHEQLIIAELLDKLFAFDEELARIVVMKLSGQFTNEQIADELGISRPTLYRRLSDGKAWLQREMKQARGAEQSRRD